MIVRFEQVNARGEASRPRVDLNALGALLDRAVMGVEMLRLQLRAAGGISGLAALREVRSIRTRSRFRVPCDRARLL
jgi:phage FluMu protein gp41